MTMRTQRAQTDYQRVRKLAELQCTEEEIADSLGLVPSAFKRRIKSDKQLRKELTTGRAYGKIHLRLMQWKAAIAGSPTILIWLGKQFLSQTDKRTDESKAEQSSRLDMLISMIDTQAFSHAR